MKDGFLASNQNDGKETRTWTLRINNVRAEVKKFHSPDIDDLRAYVPSRPDNFSFLLQVFVGPAGVDGEESFDIEVCTPDWIRHNCGDNDIVIGRHKLIVLHYDFDALSRWIKKYVRGCQGETWQEVAEKVGRLGAWEFEDYSS